jgi:hypothetical protein
MEDKMNSLIKNPVWGVIPLIIIFWSALALGEESEVNINSAVIIKSANQDTLHILAKPDLGLPDTSIIIDKAILSATVLPQTQDTTTFISVRLHPITTDWNPANVSWDNPWIEPGGDYDQIHYGEFLLTDVGNQPVEMDITSLLSRWVEGGLPYYGFLVKISRSSRHKFVFTRNGNMPYATIDIRYSVY